MPKRRGHHSPLAELKKVVNKVIYKVLADPAVAQDSIRLVKESSDIASTAQTVIETLRSQGASFEELQPILAQLRELREREPTSNKRLKADSPNQHRADSSNQHRHADSSNQRQHSKRSNQDWHQQSDSSNQRRRR